MKAYTVWPEWAAAFKRAEAWGHNAGAVIRDVRSVLDRTLVVDDKRVGAWEATRG